MIRKLLYLFLPILLLVFVSVVNAQTTTITSPQTTTNNVTRLKQQLQDIQAQRKTAISEIKQEAKTKRVELKKQIEETVQAKRGAVKDAVVTRRAEFKAKLQEIRDEKKKALVDRIDTKLTAVNTKHTDRFTQVLSHLQTLLDKITEDIDKAEVQTAIDAAKAAVENQAAKTYIITISTETALKLDVGAITHQLRQDLVATHKLVVDAKQAVQALRKDNAIMKKEATNSAN